MVRDAIEYQTVVLGALLHDIGKLLGRGSFALSEKGQHPKFSSDFIGAFEGTFAPLSDVSLLRMLVQRHHESKQHFPSEFLVQDIEDEHMRTLARLVSKADNLSSSERGGRSEQWQDYKETPLASVLERLNRVEDGSPLLRYNPRPLQPSESLDAIFPYEFTTYKEGELNQLIRGFGDDFRNLFADGVSGAEANTDFERFISSIFNILYRYTWCIPSNTQEAIPDVSLYDHLKTTAAIASCLYLYHSETGSLDEGELGRTDVDQFCLVAGDLSGIQRYIFDIATIGAGGGIARRLRARSLYVQLCTEVASHLILRRFHLPITVHTIIDSGGRFYLLLPNLPQTNSILGEIKHDIDTWFIRELNGELSLNLAWVPFGEEGFKAEQHSKTGFSNILSMVNVHLNGEKQNRFAEALRLSGKWAEDYFIIDMSYEGRDSCHSCRKFPEASGGLCSHCQLDREIGSTLPNAKYLVFYDSDVGNIPVLGYSIDVLDSVPRDPRHKQSYLITKLNDPDLSDIAEHPSMPKYLAKFIAAPDECGICKQEKAPVATFECIANRSGGEKLLGFLKADVDRLGETFIFGLKSETAAADTISRLSTLSRMLDLFFSGWIEHLTTESEDLYTIYSGGDDLFVVGPWDKILDMAEKIKVDFTRFTGNPNLTISAGVAIARNDFPIPSAAQATDAALKSSKQKGRDRITVMGTTLPWPDWVKVKEEWVKLRPHVGQIPSAFLYNLLKFSTMWRRYKEENDTLGLRYHPLLAYNISRTLDPRKTPELYQWADKILAIRPGDMDSQFILDNLGLIAGLLIYSKRGGSK